MGREIKKKKKKRRRKRRDETEKGVPRTAAHALHANSPLQVHYKKFLTFDKVLLIMRPSLIHS